MYTVGGFGGYGAVFSDGERLVPGDYRVPDALRATLTGTAGLSDGQLQSHYAKYYDGNQYATH